MISRSGSQVLRVNLNWFNLFYIILFLNWFFLFLFFRSRLIENCILQSVLIYFIWGYLNLMILNRGFVTRVYILCFFFLFFMKINRTHDLYHVLCSFFIDLFFNFIIQHWINWELSFIIYFNLLFMRLS
jgi:hypothetical protein